MIKIDIMTQTAKPYLTGSGWQCGICQTVISDYDKHGAPVLDYEECPFCNRILLWDEVLVNGWRERREMERK